MISLQITIHEEPTDTTIVVLAAGNALILTLTVTLRYVCVSNIVVSAAVDLVNV
jgi:hypothetical protein